MILVMAGTKASAEICEKLAAAGQEVIAVVTTDYGRELFQKRGIETCLLADRGKLPALLSEASLVIDASHPHNTELVRRLLMLCKQLSVRYLRFERRETDIPPNPLIHTAFNWEEAADTALKLGNVIFLTTGSYGLETFVKNPLASQKRIVVRVLPEHRVVKKCQDMGLAPKDIVAMQGPFSKKFNKAMYRALKAEVVVSKESGIEGGTDTKVSAALELGLPLVILRRPSVKYPLTVYSVPEVLRLAGQS